MTEKEYLDLEGLNLYDKKIKDLIKELELKIENDQINWNKLGPKE